MTKPVFYKNDFTCPIRLLDRDGAEVVVGDRDFTAVFHTGLRKHPPALGLPGARYTASRVGGRLENCTVGDDGRITAVFDNHGLPPGPLHCELAVLTPDDQFPDGNRRAVFRGYLGVMLSVNPGDTSGIDSVLHLKYAQGVVDVLGHIELVSDRAVYRVPVTGEAATREELPDDVPAVGYGCYGYGYYGSNQPIGLGVWDD